MCVIFARPKSEKCLSNGRKKLTETLATQAIICISRDLRVWGGGGGDKPAGQVAGWERHTPA